MGEQNEKLVNRFRRQVRKPNRKTIGNYRNRKAVPTTGRGRLPYYTAHTTAPPRHRGGRVTVPFAGSQ